MTVAQSWQIERQRKYGVWGASLRHLNTELFDNPADQKDILRAFLAANMIMKTACHTSVVPLAANIRSVLSEEPTAEEGEEHEV